MSDLIVVARTYDRTEAIIFQTLLGGAGINAVLPELATADANPHLQHALGGYRVLVTANEADEAFVILDAARADAAAREADSSPVRPQWLGFLGGLAVLFGIGAPALLRKRRRLD